MRKQIIKRTSLGFPLGISIGFIITLMISLCVNDGRFYAVHPSLINKTGNELNAVLLQTLICGLMGSGFAASSFIWILDSWSIVKQSAIYFVIASILMFPASYALNWMDHTISGIISYVSIFISIFIITWLVQYFIWRGKIKKINETINIGK